MIQQFRNLFGILTPQERRQAIGVFVLMFVAAFFQMAGVGSIFPFLSVVSNPSSIHEPGFLNTLYHLLGLESTRQFLLISSAAVLGLVVISNFVLAISNWISLRYQWSISHSIASRLFEEYLSKDYVYFVDQNTSELSKNILSEARQITSDLLNPALTLASSGLIGLMIIGLLLWINPAVTIFAIGVIGGGFVIIYLQIRRRLGRVGEEYVEANKERYKITSEAFGGIKEVKLLHREPFFLKRFEPVSQQYASHIATNRVYRLIPRYVIEGLAFGGLMALLVFLLLTERSVSSIIPLMGLFAFAGYRMMPAFRDVLGAVAAFRFHEELLNVLQHDLPSEAAGAIKEDLSKTPPLEFREELKLEDITYTYPRAQAPALKDINLIIPKNGSVAIVGKTGAGKTTLVDILLGLLKPEKGTLRIDGEEIRGSKTARWQRNIGYIPQDIYLCDDSVRRNIAFGLPNHEIDDEQVRKAAVIAHIHEFISEELPDGYHSKIGEKGVRLSGGQRQRIGIARALYHDPSVLVLDEATSDIDSVTEARITKAIKELAKTKTLVVIAHRLSTVENCDTIHLLENGRILASGQHMDLLKSSLTYRSMVRGEFRNPEA